VCSDTTGAGGRASRRSHTCAARRFARVAEILGNSVENGVDDGRFRDTPGSMSLRTLSTSARQLGDGTRADVGYTKVSRVPYRLRRWRAPASSLKCASHSRATASKRIRGEDFSIAVWRSGRPPVGKRLSSPSFTQRSACCNETGGWTPAIGAFAAFELVLKRHHNAPLAIDQHVQAAAVVSL